MQKAVREAYTSVLSDRHNMLVRNAFRIAVVVCPSRATFMSKISGELSPQQVDALWIECENNMKAISDKLWALLKAEGMEELPFSVCKKHDTIPSSRLFQ